MKNKLTPFQEKVAIEMIRYYNALVTGKLLDKKTVLKILRQSK